MPQARRRALIADLLREGGVASQEALADALAQRGEAATQATISRDLASLGVVKGRDGYRLPDRTRPHPGASDRLWTILRRHAADARPAHSLVIVRTAPGHAGVVADALDHDPPEGCLGTIAGDDTVFLATPSPSEADRLARHLHDRLGHATPDPGARP